MRRHQTEKRASSRALRVNFAVTRDLLELIDMSAEHHNGLSRSSEVTRLLLIALEQPPANLDPITSEVIGYVV